MSSLLQQPRNFFNEAKETHRDLLRSVFDLEMCRLKQKMRREMNNTVVYITQNRQIWTYDTIATKPRFVKVRHILKCVSN